MTTKTPPRVLVVDDEASIGAVAHEVLGEHGLEIVHVETIEAALDALAAEPAVVIVDKNLPDGNGLDLLPFIRRQWPDAEAVVYTGFPSMESVVEAMRHGATDYIVKPLPDVTELLHRVQLALDRRQIRLDFHSDPDDPRGGLQTTADVMRLAREVCRGAMAKLRHDDANPTVVRLQLSPIDGTLEEMKAHLEPEATQEGDDLAIAAERVRKHGGQVEVRELDGHLTLAIDLPLRGR